MKIKTWLRIGALLTAALLVSATYAFANGPNNATATATANENMSITTQTSGSTDIAISGQNTIVNALTARTEGGALVGTELAAIVNTPFARQIHVALFNSSIQVAVNNDVAPAFTERTRGDAILPIAGADITGFANLTG